MPALDPHTVDDLYLGCGLPGGESGFNMGRVVNILNGMDDVPGATITRYCASSVQTTRMAFHAIKAGEGDVFISAGVETVSRFAKGTSDSWPDTHNPPFADAEARTATAAQGGVGLARPARGRRRPRHLHRDGPDGREPRQVARASPARSSTSSASAVQNLAEKAIADGFWAREITPVTTPDGTVVEADDGPRAGVTYEAVGAAQAGVPPRRRWSPPATAARSTTAPPRS